MLDLSYVVNYLLVRKLELKSTHSRLCFPIIDRIYRKMLVGIKFSPIKVDEGIIIDGHHRYLASVLAGITVDVDLSQRTSATEIYEWHTIQFDLNDWDSESKIAMLNQQDALYNNMTIEKLNVLLK